MEKLPAEIQMGAVTLRVANLDLMRNYYTQALGLKVLAEDTSSVLLGGSDGAALLLDHEPALKHAGPSEAGLFHTAFLFNSREKLASAVASVAARYPSSFTGSADHIVSEAFYFDDPEGNGVELYFDKERSLWSWEHGQIQMGTFALDPNSYLQQNLVGDLEAPIGIGHVHLSVGNVEQARDFYVEKLGFETTLNWGGTALFVSAGGYHHHMAMNVWRSRGAGKRQQTLGLGDVSIVLPSTELLEETAERLEALRQQLRIENNKISLDDPWGNQVTLLSVSGN
jgi:catechol 2,3-dioxygenase